MLTVICPECAGENVKSIREVGSFQTQGDSAFQAHVGV